MKVSKEWLLVALALSVGFVYGAVKEFLLICGMRVIQGGEPSLAVILRYRVELGLVVNPLLPFTVFYLYGRKVDLKSTLTTVIVLLFTGLYAGNLLGRTSSAMFWRPRFPGFYSTVLRNLLPLVTAYPFFVALSASTIAYIRNTETSSGRTIRTSGNPLEACHRLAPSEGQKENKGGEIGS